MQVVSLTEAQQQLDSVIDRVADDADVTIITRQGSGDAVVMSLDHYSSLMETVHLLEAPANAAHLAESIKQYNEGKVREHGLLDSEGSTP